MSTKGEYMNKLLCPKCLALTNGKGKKVKELLNDADMKYTIPNPTSARAIYKEIYWILKKNRGCKKCIDIIVERVCKCMPINERDDYNVFNFLNGI